MLMRCEYRRELIIGRYVCYLLHLSFSYAAAASISESRPWVLCKPLKSVHHSHSDTAAGPQLRRHGSHPMRWEQSNLAISRCMKDAHTRTRHRMARSTGIFSNVQSNRVDTTCFDGLQAGVLRRESHQPRGVIPVCVTGFFFLSDELAKT